MDDYFSETTLSKYKIGRKVELQIYAPRDAGREGFYFSMLQYVIESCGLTYDVATFDELVRIEVGHVKPTVDFWGNPVDIVRSISREAMDDVEHAEFVRKASEVLARVFHFDADAWKVWMDGKQARAAMSRAQRQGSLTDQEERANH